MKKRIIGFVLTLCLGVAFCLGINTKVHAEELDYSTVQGNPIVPVFDTNFDGADKDASIGTIPGMKLITGVFAIKEDENGVKFAQTTNSTEVRVQYGDQTLTDYYVESEILLGNIGTTAAGGISVRWSQVEGKDNFYTLRLRLVDSKISVWFRPVVNGAWGNDVKIGDAPTDITSNYKTEKFTMGVAIVGQQIKVYLNGQQVGVTYDVNTSTDAKLATKLEAGSPGIRWYAMRGATEGTKWYGAKVYSLESLNNIDEFEPISKVEAVNETVTLNQGVEVLGSTLVNVTGSSYLASGLLYEITDSRVVNFSDGKLLPQSLGTTTIKVVDPISGHFDTVNVNVVKGEGPEIANISAKTAEVKSNATELINSLKEGITAGNAEVTINTSAVDVNVLGRYMVTYTATLDGKTTTVRSFVDIVDTTAPVITLSETSHRQPVITGTLYTFENFEELITSVTDNYDSEVNVEIFGADALNIYNVGDYLVKYRAIDSSGNEVTEEFTFTVYDDIAPIIQGTADITHNVGVEFNKWMFTVYAEDNADGKELCVDIEYGNYKFDQLGVYTVKYTATDKSGNKGEKTINVTVTTTTPPTLGYMNSVEENTIVIKTEEVSDLKTFFTAKDVTGLDLTRDIQFEGDYNLNKAGSYTVKAKVTDAVGNLTTLDFTLEVESDFPLALTIASVVGVLVLGGIVFIIKRKK